MFILLIIFFIIHETNFPLI